MHDVGLTHIALPVTNLENSLDFYARFANMRVVHRRPQKGDSNREVAWITDGTRPFVIVLLETDTIAAPLLPMAHLGVACTSLEAFYELCERARQEVLLIEPPVDSGPPVGHWAMLRDPDGHTLELSFGQEVGTTVDRALGEHWNRVTD